jgi:hypothetical protein
VFVLFVLFVCLNHLFVACEAGSVGAIHCSRNGQVSSCSCGRSGAEQCVDGDYAKNTQRIQRNIKTKSKSYKRVIVKTKKILYFVSLSLLSYSAGSSASSGNAARIFSCSDA